MNLHGRIDGVVNNPRNLRNLRNIIFHKMFKDDFDAVIEVHFKGSFMQSCLDAVIPI